MLKASGWSSAKIRHARLLSSLTEAELQTLFEKTTRNERWYEEMDKAFDREVRRIIRERQ